MTRQRTTSIERLKELFGDETRPDFHYLLRSELEWHQDRFIELLDALEQAVSSWEGERLVPRYLANLFCWMPGSVERIASRGDVRVIGADLDASATVSSGLRRLRACVHRFCNDLPEANE